MYRINKITAQCVDGFQDVIITDQEIQPVPSVLPDKILTKELFQTTDYPTLQPRELKIYSMFKDHYRVTIFIESAISLRNLMIAEYINVLFQDGTTLSNIDANSLEITKIGNSTKWKSMFSFSQIYLNKDNEISYLTYPEILGKNEDGTSANRAVNTLQYGYIYVRGAYQSATLGVTFCIFNKVDEFGDLVINDTIDIILPAGTVVNCTVIEDFTNTIQLELTGEFTDAETVFCWVTKKYIYTKIVPTVEINTGENIQQNVEGLNYPVKQVDYSVLKTRYYLTLAQRNDLLSYLPKSFSVLSGNVPKGIIFTDYLNNTFTSLEAITPVITEVEGAYQLYQFDLMLRYNQSIRYDNE